ncbi:uncharacterized protein LOC113004564 [Solenopsis invicta]|uniref:uncharacterized protein LOC113004564 n=1 Tax=Solenopsis invicta TaxID=13686 RepID=UPI00193CB67C|nr:uncharacterized protein LOC113004564 [Solenopsis invicta]XP_039306051.1 uncharacterized protein LOC113004564 [Solenopsis invicta]
MNNTKPNKEDSASTNAQRESSLGEMVTSSLPKQTGRNTPPAEGRDASRLVKGPSTGAGWLELFSATDLGAGNNQNSSPSKGGRAKARDKVPSIFLVRCDKEPKASPGSDEAGPAFTFKKRPAAQDYTGLTYVTPSTSRASSRTASPVSVHSSSDEAGRTRTSKRPHGKTDGSSKKYVLSSGSEEEPPPKTRGRPAIDPPHKGQYTAEAMALRVEAERAKQLKKDHRTILNPEVLPTSAPAKKASEKAMELAIEYDSQATAAVAAIVTNGLSMLAKSVERSDNIQGPIRRDLWRVFAELSAGLA